ncbi:MAG: hypothetical protein P4L51_28615 [Puia sp.]|nr:hypothetical protein [Puia sp.]
MQKNQGEFSLTQQIIQQFKDPLTYYKTSSEVKNRYKHFQLEELRLLSVAGPEKNREKYKRLALRMKKYIRFTDVLSHPETMELYVYHRMFIFGHFLKKDGFTYKRQLRAWIYQEKP